MSLFHTDEARQIQDAVARFVKAELPLERVRRWAAEQRFDESVWDQWAELGWLGIPFPEAYDGAAASPVLATLVAEGLGYRGFDVSQNYSVPLLLGLTILACGTPEQKARFLPALVRGEIRLCGAATEPDCGSDVAAVRTMGRVEGDSLVLNGRKVFCSGAGRPSAYILVVCRTDPTVSNPRRGISMVMVPNDAPGLEISKMNLMGRHVFSTYELLFDDVQVPLSNLIGDLHGGWAVMGSQMEQERIMIGAGYVGNAQYVVDEACKYAKERVAFGQTIGKFQAIAHSLVNMQIEVDAAKLLTYRAADLAAQGISCLKEASMAKLYASETLVRATNQAMQVMGGYGYTLECDMERHFRSARATTITGGTSEVIRNGIAKAMGL